MSLFNSIRHAQGGSSGNYFKSGRHVCRVSRVVLREEDRLRNIKAAFIIDAEVLHSNRVGFGEASGDLRRGDVCRAQDSFKQPQSALALVKRSMAVLKASAISEPVNPETLGMGDDCTDKQYDDELNRLVGPTQPLSGAIVTFVVNDRTSKENKPYTIFEVILPTEDDLKNAGLI